MNKLLQTLFMLMAISSQSTNAAKLPHELDQTKLLPASQSKFSAQSTSDLSALYAVQPFRDENISQPHADFMQLYQHAHSAQIELEQITDAIALVSQTQSHSSGLKSKQRALHKVNTKLHGQSDKITDLARTSLVAEDISSLMHAFQLLESQTKIVRIKNRFAVPGASGYRDLSVLVRLPESQIIAEVQLHLQAFSVIKNGQEHQTYEQIQQLQRLAMTEHRDLTVFEKAKIKRLREQSQQLYRDAWSPYLTA